MECICEPIVAEVMADRTDADSKSVKFTHLGEIDYLSLCHEQIAHLENIDGVHVVVVLDVPIVALVYLPQKACQFHLVHLGQLVDVQHL